MSVEQKQFFESGRNAERERIIALIEEQTYDCVHVLSWVMDASNVEKSELIALIKGEDF